MSLDVDEARSLKKVHITSTSITNEPRLPCLRRFIQDLVQLTWTVIYLFSGWCFIILFLLLLFTRYYWVSILVFAWLIYTRNISHQGGRRWKRLQDHVIWKQMRDYFPVNLHKTCDIDPNHNYIFGFHPHGALVVGAFMNFCTDATGFSRMFPGLKPYLLGLDCFFRFPLVSDLILLAGLCAASSESFDWILNKKAGPGNAVGIVVGGSIEVFESFPNSHVVYLKRRKGFIKKALQHGAYLVPVYSFGETDLYDQHPYKEDSIIRRLQVLFHKIVGYPPVFFYGRGIILPYRRPIDTVVGAPIAVERNQKPTTKDINRLHRRYTDALVELFDTHKTKFGVEEDHTLKII